jgi:hypothetical protein
MSELSLVKGVSKADWEVYQVWSGLPPSKRGFFDPQKIKVIEANEQALINKWGRQQ